MQKVFNFFLKFVNSILDDFFDYLYLKTPAENSSFK